MSTNRIGTELEVNTQATNKPAVESATRESATRESATRESATRESATRESATRPAAVAEVQKEPQAKRELAAVPSVKPDNSEILRMYGEMIKKTVDSTDRRRFINAKKLCIQANCLIEMFATRTKSFNEMDGAQEDDDTQILDNRIVIGGRRLEGFGDQQESVRQIIDALTSITQGTTLKNAADVGVARAQELESLLRSKKLMSANKKIGVRINTDPTDLDNRINVLRKEIANARVVPTVSADPVVPAVLLRRHQAEEEG